MKKYGFTLVEIMIVVAVIGILALMALPNITRSRLNANETAAASAMKTITSAAVGYRSTHSTYPPDMAALTATTPTYVDTDLGAGSKSGYTFSLAGGTNGFTATGRPAIFQTSGIRSFLVDESGVVRWTDQNANPSPADAVLSE